MDRKAIWKAVGGRWRAACRGIWSPLGLVVAVTLLKGWLFAVTIPYGKAPDEQAHFNYVMHIRNTRSLPVHYFNYWGTRLFHRPVEPDSAPFHPQDLPDPSASVLGGNGTYCSVHGPLYYVVCAIPVAIAADRPMTAVYISRGVSVILAAATILVFGIICLSLFPRDPLLSVAVPLLASLLPQFSFIGAMINNDNLVNLIAALLCLLWVRALLDRVTPARAFRMGMLTGLWVLTKGSFPMAVVMTICVFALDAYRHRPPLRALARSLGIYLSISALLGLPWVGRNLFLFRDTSGLVDSFSFWAAGADLFPSMTAMVLGTHDGLAPIWTLTVYKSFWGTFDWMNLPLPGWVYRICLWASALSVLGTGIHLFLHRRERESGAFLMLILFALLNFGAFAAFCFYLIWQPQGRHLFPSLFPIMAVLAVGLSTLGVHERLRRVILVLLIGGMAWLCVLSLFLVILPHYS